MPDHARRSKLVPIGLAVVIISFGVGSNFGSLILFTFNTDVLWNLIRASFAVGLACLVVGVIRNRRLKRSSN